MNFALLRSLLLFALAGLAEIGGGYLVWQWLRQGKAIWVGILGGANLILYGVIPTLQTESAFGESMPPMVESSSFSRSCGAWFSMAGSQTALM
jgi:hypothetical protein